MRSEISTGEKATGLATSTVVWTLPRWWLEMVNCRGSSGSTQIMGEGIFRIQSNYGRRHWCISHFGMMCSDWSWKGSLWLLAGESCGGGVMKLGSPWGGHWGASGKVDDTGDGEKGLSRKTSYKMGLSVRQRQKSGTILEFSLGTNCWVPFTKVVKRNKFGGAMGL